MIEKIIDGLITKFIENPKEWTLFLTICVLNLIILLKYLITFEKKWLIIGFAGICIAMYLMLYLVIVQNSMPKW